MDLHYNWADQVMNCILYQKNFENGLDVQMPLEEKNIHLELSQLSEREELTTNDAAIGIDYLLKSFFTSSFFVVDSNLLLNWSKRQSTYFFDSARQLVKKKAIKNRNTLTYHFTCMFLFEHTLNGTPTFYEEYKFLSTKKILSMYGKYNKLGPLHQLNVFLSDSSCGFFKEVHDDDHDDDDDDHDDDDDDHDHDDEIQFDYDFHSLAQAYLHLFPKYGRTVGSENQRLRQLRLTLLKRLIKLCFSSATPEEIVLEM